MASDQASQVNVIRLLHWEDRQPGCAVGRAGCNSGCGTTRAGSTARTLLSFDHSQSQKEHSLRELGGSEVPAQPDVGPARQGKHWFILAEASNGADMVAEWNKIKPAFLQNGWTIVKERSEERR